MRKKVEDKSYEKTIKHDLKMYSAGAFPKDFVHDLNNSLSSIIGYALLLQKEIKENDLCREYIVHLLNSARRAAVLVEDLSPVNKKEPLSNDLKTGLRKK